jgi:hypothetical protein
MQRLYRQYVNFALANRNIGAFREALRWIDDAAAANQEIIGRRTPVCAAIRDAACSCSLRFRDSRKTVRLRNCRRYWSGMSLSVCYSQPFGNAFALVPVILRTMRMPILFIAVSAAWLLSCTSEPKPGSEPPRKAETPKPRDESLRFPKTNLVETKVIDQELMGKPFMPGGTLARYQKGPDRIRDVCRQTADAQ